MSARLSSENKEAVEQSKKRTEEQTKHKAELQNLRMQINRLRRKGEDTEDLLQELGEKEEIYGRGKQQLTARKVTGISLLTVSSARCHRPRERGQTHATQRCKTCARSNFGCDTRPLLETQRQSR